MMPPNDPFRYFLSGMVLLVLVGAIIGTIILEGARGWRLDIARVEALEKENTWLRNQIEEIIVKVDGLPPLSQPLKVPLKKKPKCLKRNENGRCRKWK